MRRILYRMLNNQTWVLEKGILKAKLRMNLKLREYPFGDEMESYCWPVFPSSRAGVEYGSGQDPWKLGQA